MANQRALKFTKDLCSLFHKFPISDITRENYGRKLSKWYLSAEQWEDALDMLIESRDENDGRLPELHEIYPILIRARDKDRVQEALGWVWFRRKNGIDYSIRVRAADGQWLIADLVGRDSKGMQKHFQNHVGEPVFHHMPQDVEAWGIAPDNPASPLEDDAPSREEVKQILHNLSQVGAAK